MISFHSYDSFEPISSGPMPLKRKPSFIPKLNFEALSEYEETESEEDN